MCLVHAANAVTNDDGKLVGERRIVAFQIGYGFGNDLRMAVLMLQAFTV